MTITGAVALREYRAKSAALRSVEDAGRANWVAFGEFCRAETRFLPWLEKEHPDILETVRDGFSILSVEAKSEEWRDEREGVGARPAQLIPGTPGSFSDRTDWATWLLMGGRGSGKSRTGAEALRELLFGREWSEDPQVALVSRTLEQVRLDMVQRVLLEVLPVGSLIQWNRGPCEMWVDLGNGRTAFLKGFSSEAKDKLRGPNHHIAWCDEIASWADAAETSPNSEGSTWSNMKLSVRADDNGTFDPRIIATTTPKPVTLIRNPDPNDPINPGLGLYDDEMTVVSHMSTEENRANLSEHWWKQSIEPLRGTRLWKQEVEGVLMDEVLGAQWTDEMIREMERPVPEFARSRDDVIALRTLLDIKRIVVAVDPSVGAGLGDECGIVVAGLDHSENVWILEDGSLRAKASVWCKRVGELYEKWGASAVIVEINQGGELVDETLGRYAPNLPILEVWAKDGKKARAEPVALLSEQGRIFFAGSADEQFRLLTRQLKTWDQSDKGSSPDRLDAFVYACLNLIPVGGWEQAVTVIRGGSRRKKAA